MSVENPYKWRSRMPHDSDMFFGRKREIERLMDMLSGKTPQNVSIVGERRIGKSSLANRVFHQLMQTGDTLPIYLDCDGLTKTCDSDNQFFQLLSQRFAEILDREPGLNLKEQLGPGPEFSDYRGFRAFIAAVSSRDMKLVIFLDEFEHLPDKIFADNSFFSNLRALADKPDYSLAFVTISKSEIKDLTHTHKAIKSSRFYNIFETVKIGLLDHDSIKELRQKGFEQSGFVLSGEEREKISYYAGDFAFFNHVVCAFLWDAKHYNETPEWDDLEVKLLPYYKTLWDRPREEQVLLNKLKKENENDDFGLKELKVRGLVKKAGNLYYPFSDFFGSLIEKRLKVKNKITKDDIEEGIELIKKIKS